MSCQQQSQRGFVLVLTLWVLVIVALAAAYFAERVTRSVELAQQSNLNTRAMIDMASTRAELLYRLGSTSITAYGLGRDGATIYLDNRPYQGVGNTTLRLQDNRGLINLNAVEDQTLQRLLGVLGIPGDQRDHLIDTLRDFTDDDDLHRLNGAEKDEYLARNLPAPPNRKLVSPWETRAIIGWRDATQLWQNDRLTRLTTTGVASGVNPNTASAEVLTTIPGISDDIAQRIVAQRQRQTLTDLVQLADIIGIPTEPFEDTLRFWPSNAIRITQSAPGLPWALQFNVTLTPRATAEPWQIDYHHRVSDNEPLTQESNSPALPPRSTAPLETAPP
jgi:general secretion pathway protein K